MLTVFRVAIVGLEHYHVTGWVESFEQFPDRIEIVGLYDPDPGAGERLAPPYHDPVLSPALSEQYRSVPFYTDLQQLIQQSRPDIALVTVPNIDAPGVIATLAGAGVHLLIDKPGGRTAVEAMQALDAIRSANIRAAVGLNRRYGRAWQEARASIAAGRLGQLMTTEAIFTTSTVKVRNPRNPLFNPETMGGGILHWLGVHDLDLMLWLTREPIVEVQAMAGTLGEAKIDVEDVLSMSVRYASGAIGTGHHAFVIPKAGANEGYFAVRGHKGSLRIESNGTVTLTSTGDTHDVIAKETRSYEMMKAPGYGPLAVAAIDDLMAAIEEEREPLAPYSVAVEALKVIDAAYESARTGRRVRVS